jgi:MFS family permease
LAGLWVGTLVDRYHRGNLLVASLALRGLAAVLFLFPISMDNWLPIIYLVNFLLAILVQFEITIEAFLLPDLVDETQLLAADGVFGVNTLVAQGIGFLIVGPILLRIDGLGATGGAAALVFLIALLLVATLFRRPRNAEHHRLDCTEPSTLDGYPIKPATAKDGVGKTPLSFLVKPCYLATTLPSTKALHAVEAKAHRHQLHFPYF